MASWLAEQASTHGGFDVEVVDLADFEILLSLPAAPPKYFTQWIAKPPPVRHLCGHLRL